MSKKEIDKNDVANAPQQQLHQQQSLLIGNINNNKILGGFTSFDSDSLPDYSEFDSESVTLDYFKERYR